MGCCQSKESLNTKVEISEGGPDKTTILDAPKNPESGTEASQGSSAPPTVTVTVPDDFGKKALGVLRLADSVGSYVPESIGQYRLIYVPVPGLTFEKCIKGTLDISTMGALQRAVASLHKDRGNLLGICGEIAAMHNYQCAARFMSEIPVFMSSLLQAPMIGAAYKNMERILVLAPEASKLEAMRDVMLKDSGFDMDNTERFILRDFHGCREFMMYQGNQKIDAAELESAVVKHVQAILKLNDVRSIVLTSTSTLPFSDAIRKATAKPVFDHITCMEFFQKATSKSHWNSNTYTAHNIDFWNKNFRSFSIAIKENSDLLKSDCLKVEVPEKKKAEKDVKVIGVLQIDYSYPPLVGDIDHPDSFDCVVIYQKVPGLTFSRCQEGALDDGIVEAFEKAVRELEKEERLVGITGDCGFMMHYQCLVRSIARVPVFMSALVQCPTIAAAFKNDLKILVVTANSTTLIPARDILLQTCGVKITDPERFVIEGLQDLPGFEAVEKGEAVPFKQVEAGITERVKRLMTAQPEIRAVLLECTELPHYADALRKEIGIPVFDAITAVDFFRRAVKTNDWQFSYNPHNPKYWDTLKAKVHAKQVEK